MGMGLNMGGMQMRGDSDRKGMKMKGQEDGEDGKAGDMKGMKMGEEKRQ
jgi:hypothetical protein